MNRPRTSETLLLETTYTWVCNLKGLSCMHVRPFLEDKLWGKNRLPYNIFVNGNKEIQGLFTENCPMKLKVMY